MGMDSIFDHVINIPPMADDTMADMAKDITPDVTMQANIVYIAEGNIGAMNVMKCMFYVDEDRAAFSLGLCVAWKITGPMLWLLFKDVNNQDAEAMLKMIEKEEAQSSLAALPYAHYKKEK